MGKGWELLARAANLVQVSGLLPEWLFKAIRGGIGIALWMIASWVLARVSELDPALIFLIAAGIVLGLVWSAVGLKTIIQRGAVPAKRRREDGAEGVEFLALLSNGDALFRVDGRYAEVEILAYRLYKDCDAAARNRLGKYMQETFGKRKYTERDLISVIDKKQAARLEFNDLIEQGNGILGKLTLPKLPSPPSLVLPITEALQFQGDQREVENWEVAATVTIRLHKPDCIGEFLSAVGPARDGFEPLGIVRQ